MATCKLLWPSRPKNVGWCGPETERSEDDYTARVFCPKGCLDGLGAAGPAFIGSCRNARRMLASGGKDAEHDVWKIPDHGRARFFDLG
jgi:hypothetical protein